MFLCSSWKNLFKKFEDIDFYGYYLKLEKKTWDHVEGIVTGDKPLLTGNIREFFCWAQKYSWKPHQKPTYLCFVRVTEMCQATISQHENCL